jgi:hypothetical protein
MQTREELGEDFRNTMKGLIDIAEKYGDLSLNLVMVFTQLKNQAKAMVSQLDEQLPPTQGAGIQIPTPTHSQKAQPQQQQRAHLESTKQ